MRPSSERHSQSTLPVPDHLPLYALLLSFHMVRISESLSKIDSQKMRQAFLGDVPTGKGAHPARRIFHQKILGQPHTRGAEKRNYEKFGGQSIDYGGRVGVPLGYCLPGRKILWSAGGAGGGAAGQEQARSTGLSNGRRPRFPPTDSPGCPRLNPRPGPGPTLHLETIG